MTLKRYLFFLAFCVATQPILAGSSIVYNFRVAQITKQTNTSTQSQDTEQSQTPHLGNNNLSALIFNTYQKKYDESWQNFTGELTSYIRNFKNYYFRVDFAFAHIITKINDSLVFSDTQTDDLLFTAGKSFNLDHKNTISLSGLFGVPTHPMKLLLRPEFGFAQVGLGLQLDGTYANEQQNKALIYGARYIYFAPRTTYDQFENKYKFTAGNAVDLLLAAKYDHAANGIEGGYACRFQFDIKLTPNVTNLIASNYITNSFYLVYKHRFLIKQTPNRFLANIAYGFNHKKQALANKAIITAWVFWGFNF